MLKREFEFAQELVVQAGKILMEYYGKDVAVHLKDENSPVTQADRDSNEFITSEIAKSFPEDGILAEESKDSQARLDKQRVWIVDPMDGTKEFIEKVGQFAAMIGLAIDGVPVLGVVFQPTTETIFCAVKGEGAFARRGNESMPLKVSDVTAVDQMRLVVSRSHRAPLVDTIKNALQISTEVASGSVGLKVGLLGQQQSDLYIHPNSKTKEWDTCAPQVILEEAGGQITDCWGAPLQYNQVDTYNDKGFIASNGQVHDQIVQRVLPFLDQLT